MNNQQAITVALEEEKRLRRQKRPHSLKAMAELEAWLGENWRTKC